MMSLECFDIMGNWVNSGIINLYKEMEKQLWRKEGIETEVLGEVRGILRLWFGAYERGSEQGVCIDFYHNQMKNEWG